MDTFKEKRMFDERVASGNTPWTVWNQPTHQALRPAQAENARVLRMASPLPADVAPLRLGLQQE